MTDRTALTEAIVAVLGAPAIGDRSRIEHVLAEHETAQAQEREGEREAYRIQGEELLRHIRLAEAAEARCAQVEQERKGYESEADRLTTQYVDLQAEHERLRAALERWSQDIVSGLAENTSREYCIGMLTSLRCEFDNIVNRQGPWFWK